MRIPDALLTFVVFPAVVVAAQSSPQQPEMPHRFALSLSQGHRGAIDQHFQVLIVKMTNTSERYLDRLSCDSFGEMYDLVVMYNGVRVKKTATELEYGKQMKAGPGGSSRSLVQESTGPGESRYDTLYYKTTKPGTYQFTVTRRSPLSCSEKGVMPSQTL
jgi:hypothetical protein